MCDRQWPPQNLFFSPAVQLYPPVGGRAGYQNVSVSESTKSWLWMSGLKKKFKSTFFASFGLWLFVFRRYLTFYVKWKKEFCSVSFLKGRFLKKNLLLLHLKHGYHIRTCITKMSHNTQPCSRVVESAWLTWRSLQMSITVCQSILTKISSVASQ